MTSVSGLLALRIAGLAIHPIGESRLGLLNQFGFRIRYDLAVL